MVTVPQSFGGSPLFIDQLNIQQLRNFGKMYNIQFDISIKPNAITISAKYKDSANQWRKSVRKYTEETITQFDMFEFQKLIEETGATSITSSNFMR